MTMRLYGLIVILSFSFTAPATQAEIYRWVDKQGKMHFSDKAPSQVKAEKVSEQLKQHNIDHSAGSTQQLLQQLDNRQAARATEAQQKQSHNSSSSAQQQQACKEAKHRLRMMQGPVVFFDENHQQIKVTEKERQQREDELSEQIKHYCR